MRLLMPVLVIAGLATLRPATAAAHEVPARVHVTGLIRPEGDRLRILLRVPLNAMRDVEFPLYGGGFLDIAKAGPALQDAALLWVAGSLRVHEDGDRLAEIDVAAVRVSLPSDVSFAAWTDALAHVTSPADAIVELPWEQALLDVLLEFPITSSESRFAIEPMFAHLGVRTTTELRFLPPSGVPRTYTFAGDPGLLRLNPAWPHVVVRFGRAGAAAVFGSLELLLLIGCSVIGFKRKDELAGLFLPFAVGSMLPILAGAAGAMPRLMWLTAGAAFLTAAAILYLSIDGILGANFGRRVRIAFAAGIVGGAGLWYTLDASLQFAAGKDFVAVPLFSFGAQAAIVSVVAMTGLLMARVLPRLGPERAVSIVACAITAHTAWHWTIERGGALRAYDVAWNLGTMGWLQLARGAMLIVLFALVASLGYIASRRLAPAGVRPMRAGVQRSGAA